MKFFKQLIREFIFPLLLSIAWVAFNIFGSDDEWNIQRSVNVFGPTFFLLSWMTGQIFRIRKQIGVESNFESLHEKMLNLVDEIRAQTEDVSNYVTGGNSFAFLFPMLYGFPPMKDSLVLVLDTSGKYPIYGLRAKIACINSDYPEMDLNIGDTKFKTTSAYHVQNIDMQNADEYKFRIWLTARNGAFWQLLWLKKNEGIWSHALQIKKDNTILYTEINEMFPIQGDDIFDSFN